MDMAQLKIELIQKIIECEDKEILNYIYKKRNIKNMVSETGNGYKVENSFLNLSSEQLDEVNRRYKDYLKEERASISLEEFNKKIYQKHGLELDTRNSPIPDDVYDQLNEEYEQYTKGELKSKTWDEIKAALKDKDGV